ncbi:MAG TPA: aldo/keto reductase [Acidimicrobiia bacterium]|nr:aldo/keto reductase [Acidimicrobiia bacterium]
MRYIEITDIGRPVSVIGLGTTSRIFTPAGDDRVADLIDAFLAVGGNCIDTAHIYGSGESEKTLGRWLEQSRRRDEIILITKGCHPHVDEAGQFGPPRVTPEAIHSDLDESLERLATDRVDLYLLHRDDETVPPGPLLEALNEEKARGRIAAFGASNWTVDRIALANEYAAEHGLTGFAVSSPGLSLPRPVEMQFPGTLFADDHTRRWHTQTQLPVLAWTSLAAGFVSGRFRPNDKVVDESTRAFFSEENFERLRRAQEVAERSNASSLEVALAFVLQQQFPVIALVGPSRVENLEGTLGALDLDLTEEEMRYLDLE